MAILDYHQNKQTFIWNVIYCRFCGWLKTAYFGDFNKYGKGHSVERVVELKREKRSIFWSISECSRVEPISTDKKPLHYLQIAH